MSGEREKPEGWYNEFRDKFVAAGEFAKSRLSIEAQQTLEAGRAARRRITEDFLQVTGQQELAEDQFGYIDEQVEKESPGYVNARHKWARASEAFRKVIKG